MLNGLVRIVCPFCAHVASEREIVTALAEESACLVQVRCLYVLADFVVVEPPAEMDLLRLFDIRIDAYKIAGCRSIFRSRVLRNLPIEFIEKFFGIETMSAPFPFDKGLSKSEVRFPWFDEWGYFKAVAYVHVDYKIVRDTAHREFERLCIDEEKTVEEQVVVLVSEFGPI